MQREPRTGSGALGQGLSRVDGIEEIPIDTFCARFPAGRPVELLVTHSAISRGQV